LTKPKLLYRKIFADYYKSLKKNKNHISCLGIGIGPFGDNAEEEKKAKSLFGRMEFIAVRDSQSIEYCTKWGLYNAKLYSDIVFGAIDSINIDPIKDEQLQPNVGIIIRDWTFTASGNEYTNSIMRFISGLRKDNTEYSLFSFCMNGDREIVSKLRDAGEEVLQWNPRENTIREYVSKISECRVIITTRYHGALVASLLGVPFIAIGIEPKLELVGKLFDMPIWGFPYDVNDLNALMDAMLADYAKHSEAIMKEVNRQKHAAEEMFDDFARYLKEVAKQKARKRRD
jgi:polysaccharide pyruvyl transferase WcaK-like protein